MRTTALCLTLLLATACVKSSGRNSVWLVVKNESGQSLQDFSLEHGKGAFRYQVFSAGFTQGGWARVTQDQALVMSFTDGAGARMTPPLDRALTPDMIGGVFTITLGPDGRVEQNFEPRTATQDGINRFEDYFPWIGGLLALLAVPPLVLLIRRAGSAAARARSAVKRFFSNPVLEEAVARLGLARKVCPVQMYTLDPAHPVPEAEGEPAPVERQDENHHQPRAAAHDVTSTCSRVLAAAIFRLKARSSTSAAAHCATHVPTLYTWIGFHQPSGS